MRKFRIVRILYPILRILRKLRILRILYPSLAPSFPSDLDGFVLHNEDTVPHNLFGKITRAWEKVHVRENKMKRKDPSVKES